MGLSKSPPSGLPREDPKLPLLPMSEVLNTLSFSGEAPENGLPLPPAEPLRAEPKGEMTLVSSGLPRPESGEPRACTRNESAKLPAEPTEERGVALRE